MNPPHRARVTPAQRKLLLHQQLFPGDASLNLAYAYRIEGDLDVPRLMAGARRVLHACAALNTSFEDGPDGPEAVIGGEGSGPVLRRLEHHADAASEERDVVAWLSDRADRAIPASSRPQYDFTLHIGRDAFYLTALCSHLVADAYTFYNVISLIERLYEAPERYDELSPALSLDPATVVREPRAGGADCFRELLAGVESLTHDALAAPRADGGALAGVRRRIDLPAELSAALREKLLLERHRPFSVFLSAYAVVLGALSGRRDVVVGVPVANRRGHEQRAAYGYFVNMLPLPIDLTAHDTFDALCGSVAKRVFELLRHQDFDVAAHAGMPSVDNAFTLYKEPLAPRLGGCRVDTLTVPRQLVTHALAMQVEDGGAGYALNVEHHHGLTAADPAACMLEVLQQIAADDAVALRDLGVVSPARADAIDRALNARRSYAVPLSLDEWFQTVARAVPEREAVADADRALSYAELDAAIERVATFVTAHVKGPAVAISMRRRSELIAVILGTLRAGKTYVPIDPAAPLERARHIVGQFENLALVADGGALEGLDGVVRLDADAVLAGSDRGHVPAPSDLREQAAYVIFTSGSTGPPKGVEVTHRNVMRLLRASEEHFDFGAEDTWCLFHSYAFDFSVWEIFGALLYGGRLVIAGEFEVRAPEEVAKLLVRERITVLNQTPSAFRQLCKVLPADAEALAVRWVIFGGEALHPEVLRPWFAAIGERARLVNMYGITETTVHVTFCELDATTLAGERDSVIGRPLGDLSVHVVDENLHPCPPGVAGELLIGGAGVALGYRNRPDLTAERFLRGTRYGDVVYRSGDRARLRPDGQLAYCGRLDSQVQLRGFRIELGEVESALLAVDGVREAAVRLDESAAEPRLVAYLAGDAVPDDATVRGALVARLPAYMLPAQFIALPRLPLTVNGKVDDRQLPRPLRATGATGDDADELAVAIARIWSEVIDSGPVDTAASFFDVGGTSIHLAEVQRRLTGELGASDLAMVELFEFPTPLALAKRLRRGDHSASRSHPTVRPARSRPIRRHVSGRRGSN